MKRHLQGTFWGALLLGLVAQLGLASDARAQDYDAYENRTGGQGEYQATESEGDDESYAYIRTIDGTAYLVQAGTYERNEAQINEPVLVGDVIEGKGGSKIELILPDQSRIRITDKAQLEIESLAMSAETPDQPTVLVLHRGRMQFVADDLTGDYVPVIRTPNADVEIEQSGTYFIRSTKDDRTTVVVREGRATLRTDVSTNDVRETQEATARGRVRVRVEYDRARGLDSIERWGLDLDSYAYEADSRYVDQRLRYSTASLRGYGRWVPVGGTYAWRPYVRSGWRPYTNGRWRHSSHGLIWVSYDPWGWAPHHYGTWDYSAGYGWVWYPGHRYSNAWVTWYWGPTYVGWTPVGYYYSHHGHHARHRGHYYRHGYGYDHSFLGYVAGSIVDYALWSFIHHDHIGRRHQSRFTRSGGALRRVQEELARGVLTTTTEGLTPERVRSPRDAMTVLAT
ncbi:MAG: FecR family protein, partial [Gemmatimonadota bacterium]